MHTDLHRFYFSLPTRGFMRVFAPLPSNVTWDSSIKWDRISRGYYSSWKDPRGDVVAPEVTSAKHREMSLPTALVEKYGVMF